MMKLFSRAYRLRRVFNLSQIAPWN